MDIVQTLKYLLNTNHRAVRQMIEDITEEESMVTGKDNLNHIRWQTGHLVVSDRLIIPALGAEYPLPEIDWKPLFARGSKISRKSDDYPSMIQLRERLFDIYDNQLTALEKVDSSILEKEIEFFPGFKMKAAEGSLFFCQHEFYHAGQIAQLRRILGRSGLFG